MLAARYDAASVSEGKAKCKAWLQRKAGLAERPDVPMFAQIGRLDPQKGWDLLAEVADLLLEQDVQLVVLGEGHPKYHALLEDLERRHAGKFWAYLGFADDLAHQIEAGADVFLMPSLFEPCGLNQLYSLAHGTVPSCGRPAVWPTLSSTPAPRTSPTGPPPASCSSNRRRRPSGRRSNACWPSGPTAPPGCGSSEPE